MNAVLKYASLVKFAHTVFAMPFAMVGFVYGLRYAPLHNPRWPYIVLVQVILCMVFARNTAMGFNRWADRRIDAENPRTAGREIPAGVIPARHALRFVAVNALLFIAAASTINLLTALLSPVALFIILFYSYCKRFTALAHLVLGLSLGIAPVGAYIAVTGRIALEPCILSLLVMTIVIPIGIFSRYVLNRGESWPEPIAIICMVTFTFIGAAVSYRAGSHIAVNMLTDRLPASLQRLCARVVDLLMLLISGLMCWYSYWLCVELWEQPVAEFPLLTSGESYLPLPVGSAILILFVLERLLFGSQENRPVVLIGNHS